MANDVTSYFEKSIDLGADFHSLSFHRSYQYSSFTSLGREYLNGPTFASGTGWKGPPAQSVELGVTQSTMVSCDFHTSPC